jgi:hypothetical protein
MKKAAIFYFRFRFDSNHCRLFRRIFAYRRNARSFFPLIGSFIDGPGHDVNPKIVKISRGSAISNDQEGTVQNGIYFIFTEDFKILSIRKYIAGLFFCRSFETDWLYRCRPSFLEKSGRIAYVAPYEKIQMHRDQRRWHRGAGAVNLNGHRPAVRRPGGGRAIQSPIGRRPSGHHASAHRPGKTRR